MALSKGIPLRIDAFAVALLVAFGPLLPDSARAEEPALLDKRTRDEARQRFDRGLTLYNSGDMIGALAEFQHAHKLTGHPFVLFNLALVQARLGYSADALDSLEKLRLSGESELGADARARAKTLYEAELARVGTLQITTRTQRSRVQIDGVDATKMPVKVTAGTHFVSVSAEGFEPRHLKITVAGRATEVVEVDLTPLEEAPAELTVTSNVPGVEVRAGGQVLGRTPLRASLPLKAGGHEIELSRDGYVPVRKHVLLGAGGKADLQVQMQPTDAGLRVGGTLALRVSELDSVVTIDGKPTLDHTRGLRLPIGVHAIRVERAGFFDVERDVVIRPGKNAIDATLLPTPEYLGDYVGRAKTLRLWSYIAGAAGAVSAAGGGVFLVYNQGLKNNAKRAFDDYAAGVRASPNGTCRDDACAETLGILSDDLEAKRQRDVYGWLAVGAGAVAMTSRMLLYVLGDDPARYDPKPESDVFDSVALDIGPKAVALRGVF